MRGLVDKVRSIVQGVDAWQVENPGDAALAFDITVVAVGLLAVCISPLFRGTVIDEPTAVQQVAAESVAETQVLATVQAYKQPSRNASSHQDDTTPSSETQAMSVYKPEWPSRHTTYRIEQPDVPMGVFDAQFDLVSGELDAALTQFTKLEEVHPDDPATLYHLALALYLDGQVDEATEAAQRGAELERRYGLQAYGKLMERVQGPHRVWLEKIRRSIVRGTR